jgi:hypothetical protein
MPISGTVESSTAPANDTAMTMSHAHCRHAGTPRNGNPVDHRFEDASTCSSVPCTQASILSAPMSGKDGRGMEGRHLAAAVAMVSTVDAIGSIASHTMRLEHAPPELILVDPLSVALRI